MNETIRQGDRVRWRKGEGRVETLLEYWVEVRDDAGELHAFGYDSLIRVDGAA